MAYIFSFTPHLLLIYSSLCKCFYLKSYAFHVSKLYVYRDGVDMGFTCRREACLRDGRSP